MNRRKTLGKTHPAGTSRAAGQQEDLAAVLTLEPASDRRGGY